MIVGDEITGLSYIVRLTNNQRFACFRIHATGKYESHCTIVEYTLNRVYNRTSLSNTTDDIGATADLKPSMKELEQVMSGYDSPDKNFIFTNKKYVMDRQNFNSLK